MKHTLNDNPTNKVVSNFVRVPRHFFEILQQTDKSQWEQIFNEFRLNLQSRIAGSDERDLLKLQAKLEYINELEKFFLEMISSAA